MNRFTSTYVVAVSIVEKWLSKFCGSSLFDLKMGRTRTKTKKNIQTTSSTSPPSIPSLLEKAQELIIQCDYELAQKFVQRVIDKEPTNVEAREMMGVVLLEMGEIDSARSVSRM